jgi:carboxyl-terminal processing protease
MKKPAVAVIACLVATGALLGGLFGSDAQATVDNYSQFLRRYTKILRVVETEYVKNVEPERLVHASIRGMLRTLDPHSNFLARREYTQLQERQKGSYYGLGISVQMVDGVLTVVSPFEGTPAYRLGIRSGDIISKIEGEETRGMDLDDAVKRLRGAKGSKVTISITRVGYEHPLDFTIVRDEIKLRSVPYAFKLDDGSGYLRISDFTETTETELLENMEKLEAHGIQRLVLDLRDNPGGLLDQAVAVSNTFLKKGTKVVSTRGRTHGSDQDFYASQPAAYGDLPIVVLVNRGSASASEIVAGAIQDHDRGLIVGETTFGKGLVQSIYRISGGNGLALTTAKYFTPSGRSIQRDYSGSIDDYYYTARRRDDVPTPQGELRHTDAGRKVYGGGGITPDVEVSYPQIPKPILSLSTYNVFFNYAALYASKNGRTKNVDGAGVLPEEIRTARPKDVRLIDKSFVVDDDVLGHFFQFLTKEEVPFKKEELLEHRDALALFIKAEIFSSLWGAEARQRVLLEKDPQVFAAVEALPDAADLMKDPKSYVSRMAARDEGSP